MDPPSYTVGLQIKGIHSIYFSIDTHIRNTVAKTIRQCLNNNNLHVYLTPLFQFIPFSTTRT